MTHLEHLIENTPVDFENGKYHKLKTNFPKHSLCIYCNKNRKINYTRQINHIEYRGKPIKFVKLQAWCSYCGWPVDVPGMWDAELDRIKLIYNKQFGAEDNDE